MPRPMASYDTDTTRRKRSKKKTATKNHMIKTRKQWWRHARLTVRFCCWIIAERNGEFYVDIHAKCVTEFAFISNVSLLLILGHSIDLLLFGFFCPFLVTNLPFEIFRIFFSCFFFSQSRWFRWKDEDIKNWARMTCFEVICANRIMRNKENPNLIRLRFVEFPAGLGLCFEHTNMRDDD